MFGRGGWTTGARSLARSLAHPRALLLGASLLASCTALRGPDSSEPPPAADDPRLAQLGLLYDDTIVTQSGRTVDFNGQAVIPRYLRVQKTGSGAKLSVDVALANVVLGLSKDLTVKLGLPYVSKRLERPGGASTLRSEGPGDAPLTVKYRFFQRTGPARTTEAALIAGIELPTGNDDVRQGGARLPAPLQPGSGSLDAILGGAITRVDGRWLASADLIGKLNGSANDYRFGNVLRADFGGQYRAHPVRYVRWDQLTVNLVAELNSVWSDRDRMSGSTVQDSGGFKLFATPGVQVILNRNFLLEAAVQLPLVLDLNGDQLEEEFIAIIGLRARF